jgi:hypothetical protein
MPKLDFLNADLEMLFAREPKCLLRELGRKVIVLYSGPHPKGHLVTMELSTYVKCPHKALKKWVKLLKGLRPAAKREFKAATSRVLDLGFDIQDQGRCDRIELPAKIVNELAGLRCACVITLYALDDAKPVVMTNRRQGKRSSPR